MYIDNVKIKIKSGNGGAGCVNFHREKYVPKGGPDGGDGGKGGDIIFETDKNMRTLLDFRYTVKYYAEDGEKGDTNNMIGASADNYIIKVPSGTVIKNAETGAIIADMITPGVQVVVLKGGKGGKGNAQFATPTRQSPNFAQPGQHTKEYEVLLELKTIADVGLVGYPNVGKSTLLSVVSAARPKIANYQFTTLSPNLGVVSIYDKTFVMADIPGLIENAHEGVGLGHDFLRHIERTRMLVHVLDAAGIEGRDPVEDYNQIRTELESYSEELSNKPEIIAANKMDLPDAEAGIEMLKEYLPEKKVFPISGVTKEGVKELLSAVSDMLETLPEPIIYEGTGEILDELVEDAYDIYKDEDVFVVEGSLAERILASVNVNDYDSMTYFHRMLKKHGILDDLRKHGAKDGDTIRFVDTEFDFTE
ncbi:MAG: GTPase ObgE [Clostridiales bacterium]|nr:GTPase ObgE [Clostridiales bacterium]